MNIANRTKATANEQTSSTSVVDHRDTTWTIRSPIQQGINIAKVLYLGDLPDRIGRGAAWPDALQDDRLTITNNKQFLKLDDPITDQDEIALISKGLGRS